MSATPDPRTFRELCEELGEAAMQEIRRSVASAPPLSPKQLAELAVLLRRDPPARHDAA